MKTLLFKLGNPWVYCIFLIGLLLVSGCKKEDDIVLEPVLLACNSFHESNTDKITHLENLKEGVDYIIDCKIRVDIDLVIDPGVTIAFTTGSGMEISTSGSIHAVGANAQQIVFTGEDAVSGSWLGILSRSNDVKNRIENCLIEFAGGGAFNSNGDLGSIILWANTYFRIVNTIVRNGAAAGINANYSNYNVEITNCTISACSLPISTADANIVGSISGGDFTGNTTDVIKIGKAGGPVLSATQSWTDLGVPYRIATTGLIVRDATLTIQPGVTIEMENGARILIGHTDESTLIAVGTPAQPIVFTGVSKIAGAWKNIEFNATKSPLNEIAHAIIEYGGGPNSEGAIYMWAQPVLSIHDVQFRNIASCAIYDSSYPWDPNPFLTEFNNTIENVAGGYMCI